MLIQHSVLKKKKKFIYSNLDWQFRGLVQHNYSPVLKFINEKKKDTAINPNPLNYLKTTKTASTKIYPVLHKSL